MGKRLVALFIAGIFFWWISPVYLCLTAGDKNTDNCCSRKTGPISTIIEGCFLLCAKQNVSVLEESYLGEDLKTKSHFFLSNQPLISQHDLVASRYGDIPKAIIKLDISQIYFAAILNHAPPAVFKLA